MDHVQPKLERGLVRRSPAISSASLTGSSGSPVPPRAQRILAPFTGNFAGARIHDDPVSHAAARSIGAQAFTLGKDVYFGAGKLDLGSPRGLALLGHELTHVRQGPPGIARRASSPYVLGGADRYEAEAERNERRILSALSGGGGMPPLGASRAGGGRIRRSGGPVPEMRASAVTARGSRFVVEGLSPGNGSVTVGRLTFHYGASVDAPTTIRGARATQAPGAGFAALVRQSSGSPLPPPVRSRMEGAFGRSFGAVRVHTDAAAGRAARSIGAHAFTSGKDVYFAPGHYQPRTPRGLSLIGHELTHVAQEGAPPIRAKSYVLGGADRFEAEAERNEARIYRVLSAGRSERLGGLSATAAGSAGTIHRKAPHAPIPTSAWIHARKSGSGTTQIDKLVLKHRGDGTVKAHRKASGASGAPTLEFAQALRRSSGRPLATPIRSRMESMFGRSLGGVNVHSDTAAAVAAHSIGAHAFTIGQDVYFGAGRYDTGSPRGVALLGHELTHVLQGGGGTKLIRASMGEGPLGSPFDAVVRRATDDAPSGAGAAVVRRAGKDAPAGAPAGVGAARQVEIAIGKAGSESAFVNELVAMDDAKFWATIRSWTEKEFTRFIFDDIKNVSPYPALHDRFRKFCETVADRMIDQVSEIAGTKLYRGARSAEATGEAIGKVNVKDTAGLLKKLREKKHLKDVDELTRSRVVLNKGTLRYNPEAATGTIEEMEAILNRLQKANDAVTGKPLWKSVGLTKPDMRILDKAADPRGRCLVKNLKDAKTGIIFQLEIDASQFDSFSEGIKLGREEGFLIEKGAKGAELHDIGYKGADQIVKKILPLHPELAGADREAITKLYDIYRSRYLKVQDMMMLAFEEGRVISPEMAKQIAQQEGLIDAIKDFFGNDAVQSVIKEWGKAHAPPIGLEEKVFRVLPTDKARAIAITEGAKAGTTTDEAVSKASGNMDEVASKSGGWMTRSWTKLSNWFKSISSTLSQDMSSFKLEGPAAKFKSLWQGEEGLAKTLPRMSEAVKTLFTGSVWEGVRAVTRLGGSLAKWFGALLHVAGPLLSGFMLFEDVRHFLEGPQALAYAGNKYAKQHLNAMDAQGTAIYALYWVPTIVLDVVDFLSTFIPVLKPFGLGAGLIRLAWGGFTPKWSGGFYASEYIVQGADKLISSVGGLFRKRRGDSSLADEDPDLAMRAEEARAIYGNEPGVSLDISTKYRLERLLGVDLGEVRLHTGPLAAALGRATEAEALTIGRDIYLPDGALDTTSWRGLGLLAHEATHVAQEGPATPKVSPFSLGKGSIEAMEDMAYSVQGRVSAGPRAPVMEYRSEITAPAATPAPSAAIVAAVPVVTAPVVTAPAAAAAVPHRQAHASTDATQKTDDPIAGVMQKTGIPATISQEDFLDMCKEKVLDLMMDELRLDEERGQGRGWNETLPLS
jgi:hypothetical protein